MITSDGGIVVPPGEGGGGVGAAGAVTYVKATGEETGGLLEAFEQLAPAGSGPPLHIHHDCSETFCVVEGEFQFEIGSEVAKASTGGFVFVPKGIPHRYANVGSEDGRILFWFTPAARMAGYFRELAARESAHESDSTLEDIAARHGVEIVR